ncbi:hypothetical protein SH528x_004959 [Novipirellula sp. SH528]|uniref:hypothetical protein n=1 Tax=Novipirellula sp. SH528 TaxID=3454466 RepID=UPI003FA0273D
MAIGQALPWPDQSNSKVRTDHDFGEFVYSPTTDSWCSLWLIEGIRPHLSVVGYGPSPSELQKRIWAKLLPTLGPVVIEAISAIPLPPGPKRIASEYDVDRLVLSEVRFNLDSNAFDLFFDSNVSDEIDLWPMVTFTNDTLEDAGWAP